MPGLARRLALLAEPLREARCVSCAMPVPFSQLGSGVAVLCRACAKALARRERGYCPRCGNLAASSDATPAPCGDCLRSARPWERFFFHAAYRDLTRALILRFKNGHELALADLLGRLLAGHPELTGPYDAVIPVPLHPSRLRERGFNQALELARPLARRLKTPLEPALLARTANSRPQAGLSLEARKNNVRGLFSAGNKAAGRRLLLVDDIATTCATLESAVNALLRAGAESVDTAVLARTPEYFAD